MITPLTTEEFIQRCQAIYGDACDYSKVIYKNQSTKVCITCNACKTEYLQTPANHYTKVGCPICRYKRVSIALRKSTEEFIRKSKAIHGNRYKYINTVYRTARHKVTIECRIHGNFLQSPFDHLAGKGCKECRTVKIADARRNDTEYFIEKATAIHNGKYTYENSRYKTAREHITITCPTHGEFVQTADSHLRGTGCPRCSFSKGELAVAQCLESLNIPYEQEKKFPECKDKRPLQFDFYFCINETHFLVEYHGLQHSQPVDFFERKGTVKHEWYKRHDKIKRKFAKKYGFIMIEIWHTEKDIQAYLISEIRAHTQDTLPNLTYPIQLNLLDALPNQSEIPLA